MNDQPKPDTDPDSTEPESENNVKPEPQDYVFGEIPASGDLTSSDDRSAADEQFTDVQELFDKTKKLQKQVNDQKTQVHAIQAIVVFGFIVLLVMVVQMQMDFFSHKDSKATQPQNIVIENKTSLVTPSPSPKPSPRPTPKH